MKHLFTLFLFFVAMAGLQAKHIIGGVLSYECLGDGNYRFTMKMYRDCCVRWTTIWVRSRKFVF